MGVVLLILVVIGASSDSILHYKANKTQNAEAVSAKMPIENQETSEYTHVIPDALSNESTVLQANKQ